MLIRGVNWEVRHVETYWSEQQIEYMKQHGYNTVRYTVIADQGRFPVDKNNNLVPYPARINEAIEWTRKRGMKLILTFFDYTYLGDFPSSEGRIAWMGRPDLADYATKVQDWIDRWVMMATDFKGNSHVMYEVFNEPFTWGIAPTVTGAQWYDAMQRCTNAIRNIAGDGETPIIISCKLGHTFVPGGFESGVQFPVSDPANKLWYMVNCYPSWWNSYCTSREQFLDYAQLEAFLLYNRKWQDAINAGYKLLIGETGRSAIYWNDLENQMQKNFLSICEKHNIGFNVWWWYGPAVDWSSVTSDWNGTPSAWGDAVRIYLTEPPPWPQLQGNILIDSTPQGIPFTIRQV